MSKEHDHLCETDRAFVNNLRSIIGGEITQVKRGLKSGVDIEMIAEWCCKRAKIEVTDSVQKEVFMNGYKQGIRDAQEALEGLGE